MKPNKLMQGQVKAVQTVWEPILFPNPTFVTQSDFGFRQSHLDNEPPN